MSACRHYRQLFHHFSLFPASLWGAVQSWMLSFLFFSLSFYLPVLCKSRYSFDVSKPLRCTSFRHIGEVFSWAQLCFFRICVGQYKDGLNETSSCVLHWLADLKWFQRSYQSSYYFIDNSTLFKLLRIYIFFSFRWFKEHNNSHYTSFCRINNRPSWLLLLPGLSTNIFYYWPDVFSSRHIFNFTNETVSLVLVYWRHWKRVNKSKVLE